MAFKMSGFPTHKGTSMNKQTSDAGKNLLKAVPNEEAYNKLSDIDKIGFDKAAKKAGLPMEKTIAKQKVVKEGEGQDQNKIFDEKGNHIGDYVNGKAVYHYDTSTMDRTKRTIRKSLADNPEDAKKVYKTLKEIKSPAKPSQ